MCKWYGTALLKRQNPTSARRRGEGGKYNKDSLGSFAAGVSGVGATKDALDPLEHLLRVVGQPRALREIAWRSLAIRVEQKIKQLFKNTAKSPLPESVWGLEWGLRLKKKRKRQKDKNKSDIDISYGLELWFGLRYK